MCIDLGKARTCCSHVSNARGLACDPQQMSSVLKYHSKTWYHFVVPHFPIPNFASAKISPLRYLRLHEALHCVSPLQLAEVLVVFPLDNPQQVSAHRGWGGHGRIDHRLQWGMIPPPMVEWMVGTPGPYPCHARMLQSSCITAAVADFHQVTRLQIEVDPF